MTRKFIRKHARALIACAVLGLAFCIPGIAHAATAGGGALPWDGPITTLRQDVTGPLAFGIAIIGMAGAGMMLILNHGEMTGFVRTICYVIVVGAFLVGLQNGASALGITGAMVA